MDSDDTIVRCFCCGNWVRKYATKIERIGDRGDEELWCIGCIDTVDTFTSSLGTQNKENEITLDLEEGE